MPRSIGRLTKIGLGKEATPGTAVAPTYWIPVLDLDFDDQFDLKDNESGYGNLSSIQDSRIVKKWGGGDYSGKIFNTSVGLELTLLFGQSPTSVQRTTTGVYDHSYTMLQTNQHKTATIAVTDPNYSGRYPYGMIDSWSLTAEVGDFIRRSVTMVSVASASSSESVSYTDEDEFLAGDITAKFAAAGAADATLDAASTIKVTSISFEINKNAEALQVLGTNAIDSIVNKQVEVTGTIELFYDDRTYHTLALAGTHQSMRVEMLNAAKIIGTSGTHNPALRFQFAEIALEFPARDFDNNDINTLSIPFRAMLNLATGSLVSARLTNAYVGTNY